MANNWDYIPLELKDNEPDSAPHTSVLNINDPMEIADESSKRVMLNSGAIPFTNLSKPGASPVHNNNSQGASNTSEMLRINSVEEAPLARIEFEDDEREDDDREFVSRPYPGVDDGFFADNDVNDSRETFPGDVELIPKSKHPEELAPHTPELTPRVAPDGENRPPDVPPSPKELPRFPLPRDTPDFHGFKPSFSDEETGTQVLF
ncbi:uncharacterized protein LOC126744243 isoform X2 [Anthonomus grandis grandis]|uniref:uncharacterized protein LOC126744243 isoform X2 n=1 Tax=Anthonomus grandis grandis TaxID=2921223 RepID=UPI0021669DC6|nr:uncharacterized protein LOC126744243 isoform X2 [Anthonomus grandis grandis]